MIRHQTSPFRSSEFLRGVVLAPPKRSSTPLCHGRHDDMLSLDPNLRTRQTPAILGGDMDEAALKFVRGLRAVREYTPEPVTEDELNAILEVGRWTSTGGNRQPCDVVVVRDPAVRQKFADWG